MNKSVRIHQDAKQELRDEASWYDHERAGLGDQLVAAIQSTIPAMQRLPNSGRPLQLPLSGHMI